MWLSGDRKQKEFSKLRQACSEKIADELEAIRSERASGVRVAGYACHAFPEAVAAGLGLRPVRVLCGASASAESSGERLVRADVCPLVKSMLGNIYTKQGLHAEVDIWIGLYTCDQMRRAFHFLSSELGQEVHPIQLPATRTEDAAAYYAFQIGRFVSDMETLYGLKFDLVRAADWYRHRKTASEFLSRTARSGAVSPVDLHLMFHLFFVSRPHGLAGFFETALALAQPFQSRKKVILVGSPLALEDTVILEAMEAYGVAVVPLNCSGLNSVEGGYSLNEDNFMPDGLAHEAFRRPACARTRPNSSVYERIRETVESSGASGIILKCLKFCDHWYTERRRIEKSFDLPVLVLDSVYAEGERNRTLNRVEAFLEMVSDVSPSRT